MKPKTLLINAACMLSIGTATAQFEGFHLGGRIGLGESTIAFKNANSLSPKLFVAGGFSSNYQFNSLLGLNADFLLTSKGGRYNGYETREDVLGSNSTFYYQQQYNFLYAEVPVTGQISLRYEDFGIRAYAGPSMNFKLAASETKEYENMEYNARNGYSDKSMNGVANTEYAWVYGAGISVRNPDNKIFFLDLRYSRAQSSFARINNNEAFNNYYVLSAGYMF